MRSSNDIDDTISFFYPIDKSYNLEDYQTSKEYKNLLKIRKKYFKNYDFKNHLKMKLKEIYSEYAIIDWTDLPNSNCYEYKILMNKNQQILDDDVELIHALGGRRRDLRLFISILSPYYHFFLEESTYNFSKKEWSFNKHITNDREIEDAVNKLRIMMKSENIIELSTGIVSKVVANVETQYLEKGEVKIFHLLFSDLVTI
jgi:hypothetical protein